MFHKPNYYYYNVRIVTSNDKLRTQEKLKSMNGYKSEN